MATPSSARAGAVCDDKGVCTLPPRASAREDDGSEGLVPLPRTLRPLGVLEDEAGNKLAAPGVFKSKVPICAHVTNPQTAVCTCPLSTCSNAKGFFAALQISKASTDSLNYYRVHV